MKLVIIATARYSINACDFDLLYRNSQHEIVKVLYHRDLKKKRWLKNGKPCPGNRNGYSTTLLDHPNDMWVEYRDLLDKLAVLDFDYICLGNGGALGPWLAERLNCKFLYSEYGWMPWKECFYIDGKGVGARSSLTNMSEMPDVQDHADEIEQIKNTFDKGKPVPFKNFVYVPLQVDTPTSDGKKDFKFNFTRFGSNREFLFKVREVVSPYTTILVKNHPAAKQCTKVLPTMVDITDMNLNKYELYDKMQGMVCINSTSALECLLFDKKLFAYGRDIFSNKRIAHENVDSRQMFTRLIEQPHDPFKGKKFINMLLDRQVYRHKCSDEDYVKSHYWCESL